MSLMTQAYLLDKYGPRLNMAQLAEVLGLEPGTVLNQVSAGALQVKTYREGRHRWADYRDVAEHLDRARALAA